MADGNYLPACQIAMTPEQKLAREETRRLSDALRVHLESMSLRAGPAQMYWLMATDNLDSIVKNSDRAIARMDR